MILHYFKKLKKERELKKLREGLILMAQYTTEMVADGTMTAEKAENILVAAIEGYVDKKRKPV